MVVIRGVSALAVSALLVFANVVVQAQSRPNFSGQWTYTPPTARATTARERLLQQAPPGGFCDRQCTLTQTGTSLTVTGVAGRAQAVVFEWNRPELRRSQTDPRTQRTESIRSRVAWDGAALTIASSLSEGTRLETLLTKVWLEDGHLLIETRIERAGRVTTRRLRYARS